jgi:hypothetical protein
MRSLAMIAISVVLWQNAATAQTPAFDGPSGESPAAGDTETGVVGTPDRSKAPEFAPLTRSERLRLYLLSTYGPGAIARAIAVGGINQASGTPKEWGGGAKAFGERIGNTFAEHVIRKTLESGAAYALHEDNRYFRSNETGFMKRTKHAVTSVFLARNEAGGEHFAYSRFGGALGASFISRAWQPRSATTSGDAMVNFGITMAADMGWNVFKEFMPRRLRH